MSYLETKHGAKEILLWIDNEQSFYNQKQAIIENLRKKKAKKIYNSEMSLKLWKHLTDRVRLYWNKKFAKDMGENISVSSSRMADKELRDYFEENY